VRVLEAHHKLVRAMRFKIYNWFAEGFDIAGMKNAKTLLGEPSA
jgi:hypothetical protein